MSTLTVTPSEALVDEQLTIIAEGLDPGQEATLVATWQTSSHYRGTATFVADEDGRVDPAAQAPVSGDYEGVRPMGLVQFARETGSGGDDGAETDPQVDNTHRLRVALVVDGETHDESVVVRRTLAADVDRIPVERHDQKLVGDFFLPSGEGPHPGLVLLGGSGGGIPNGVQAKLLASHGYAVLALAYFQPSELGADTDTADRPLDRVPETLHRVPLSYFDRAVSWLVDHEQVGAIGIHGGSRGSEPAVLTASRNEAVSSVVVSAPLAYAFCTFESDAFGEPAWVTDGQAYPYLTNQFRFGWAGWLVQAGWLALTGGNVSYAESFRRAVEQAPAEKREATALPVEEAGADMLVLSGTDDELAPSTWMGEQLVARLDDHDYEHEYAHHSYDGAGHLVSAPYTPVRGRRAGDPIFGRMGLAFGGTPGGYADADVDAWGQKLAFLDRTLRRENPDEPQITRT